jgi:hypothetical protein
MKYITLLVCLVTILGCTPVAKRSTYPNGWSDYSSGITFKMCARYHLGKDMPVEPNLDLLVSHGLLNEEQAERVRHADVRVDDPECAVYAAYGLSTGAVTFHNRPNQEGLISKDVIYWCSNSQAPCPGVVVSIADGRVTGMRAATDSDRPKPLKTFP